MYNPKGSPLSTSNFRNSKMAFFDFVESPSEGSKILLPKKAQEEHFMGIADLEPIFAQRLFLRRNDGEQITYGNDDIPVSFSVFGFDEEQSSSNIFKYWDRLLKASENLLSKAKMWNIAPRPVWEIIFKELIQNSPGFYHHDSNNKNTKHLFGVTLDERLITMKQLKTYLVSAA